MYQRSGTFPDTSHINNIHSIILHCHRSSPIQTNGHKLAYKCLQISREIYSGGETALCFVSGAEHLSSAGNLAFWSRANLPPQPAVYLNSQDHLLQLSHVFADLQLLIKGDEYQH